MYANAAILIDAPGTYIAVLDVLTQVLTNGRAVSGANTRSDKLTGLFCYLQDAFPGDALIPLVTTDVSLSHDTIYMCFTHRYRK